MIVPEPSPATSASRVLVVDDEPALVRGVTIVLRGGGYVVESARTASEALAVVVEHPPDALVLDLVLPDGDGIELCGAVRRMSNVPILFMSAIGAGRENRHALDASADDYLPKPFRAEELLGRVNRMLPASAESVASATLEIGELVVDLVRRRVTRAGTVLLLEPVEFELVRVLAQRQGRTVTDRELLRAAWPAERGRETRRLRLAIARLRAKLGCDQSRAAYLVAEPGIGYRLASPAEALR